ncbi:TetR/AcrR family transcriptional regulator [uncultured Lactobacillus sp.]|uniref:TetR/AcrR family transcriptional regulator n=1 Tax=uncultured Lactobacillus sp. TaxID=153152 RepID=UPI002804ACCB|nr:TetR/AcrR family transcriptional regulator [uncultured Lactobacillus sp.]
MNEAFSSYEQKIENEKMPAGKKKVIIASLHLFANNGFHATTTAEIAKAAGVSEGTIYKYFRSKEDLMNKLLLPILENIKNGFFFQIEKYQTLDELIDFAIVNRLQFLQNNFELIKLIMQELLTNQDIYPTFQKILNGKDGILTSIKNMQQHYPEINQNLSPEQIIRIIVAPVITLSLQENLFGIKSKNTTDDLKLVKKQIIAGLAQ